MSHSTITFSSEPACYWQSFHLYLLLLSKITFFSFSLLTNSWRDSMMNFVNDNFPWVSYSLPQTSTRKKICHKFGMCLINIWWCCHFKNLQTSIFVSCMLNVHFLLYHCFKICLIFLFSYIHGKYFYYYYCSVLAYFGIKTVAYSLSVSLITVWIKPRI